MDTKAFQEEINKYNDLINKEADPKKPYEYKYQGRDLLNNLMSSLSEKRKNENINEEELKTIDAQMGIVLFHYGVNYFETDETSSAEKHLLQCILHLASNDSEETSIMDDDELSPKKESPMKGSPKKKDENPDNEDVLPHELYEQVHNLKNSSPISMNVVCEFADAFNYIGMIWTNRANYRRAVKYFKRAERIYNKNIKLVPEHLKQRMEEISTMTIFYLAQVYGYLKHPVMSAKYCYLTLRHQLMSKKDFDKVEWAVNCMHLSGYYLGENDFAQAEHCLLAAKHILPKGEDKFADANIHLAMGNFYMALLEYSKDYLIKHCSSKENEDDIRFPTESFVIKPKKQMPTVGFDGMLPIPPKKEHRNFINFQEALQAFKAARAEYDEALKYYVLDGYVTEHIDILRNYSNIYKCLSVFEQDIERRCAMHKRRADLLQPIIDQLNPKIYSPTLKQLTFELGEIYQSIMDLMLVKKQIPELKPPSSKRINEYAMNSINFFTKFINYFVDPNTKQLNVEDINKGAFLRAHLCIAQLYYKMEGTKSEKVEYLIKSLRKYEYIHEFAKKNPVKELQQELKLCDEMRELLPIQIDRYKYESSK